MQDQFERHIVQNVLKRLLHPPELIQVVTGPRQVGKTTAAHQISRHFAGPVHFCSADGPRPFSAEWIVSQWEYARVKGRGAKPCLLVLDEVQKIAGWSEAVKFCFDADRASGASVKPLLLGSSALLLVQGTRESLAGRFFLHRCGHWSFGECCSAFDWDLDTWLYFGGYPGAVPFIEDEESWRAYINDSLIETVLTRDVLSMHAITKPALLRHLFGLISTLPGRIVSYNKMLGQLTDAGNTTTLAHYLGLMEQAYFASGLEKYSRSQLKKKTSPKVILWNNALITAPGMSTFEQTRSDPALWGRLVENAVGAHLLSHLQGMRFEVGYWRDRHHEVDFVVTSPRGVVGIEVKSGRGGPGSGFDLFKRRFPDAKTLIVGNHGIPLNEFFERNPIELL